MKNLVFLHKNFLKTLMGTVFICFVFAFSAQAQKSIYFPEQTSTCQKTECSNSTCQLTLNSAGQLSEQCPSGKRYDVDPNCVMNKNAEPGSCLDTMPVAKITRVAETNCYRANGAGGNSTPRNHLGTDYAATEGTVITAAADGQIVWAKPLGGGGNTIMIEHTKKCPCSGAGCDNKYITVYMHLSDYIVKGGSVKKGQAIGYVGGSNYVSARGELCQYGHGTSTCHPYGPHLHFEIHSGSFNKGYNTLKKSIINPLCDDIQSFCGGCSYNVQDQCTGKTNTSEWEKELTPAAQEQKKPTNTPPGISSAPLENGGSNPSAGKPDGKNKGCDYQNFLLTDDTCLFCPIFKILFNTASSLSLKAYKALTNGVVNVVIAAFAVWVAWFILQQISSLEAKKPSKMIQELMIQAFRVLMVVLILKVGYGKILGLTIEPVFNTGMTFVQTIMDSKGCSPSASYMQPLQGYEGELNEKSTGGLPLSMGRNVLCSIKSMQDGVWRIVAFGKEARCVGWREKAFIKKIIPHFSYVFTGDFLIVAGIILLLAFPWCLVDCVLNMGVASALIPAAIGGWAFKLTASYLKKVWDFFMNAMFNFVFLSIILYIIITVVNQFLDVINTYATDYDSIISPIYGLAFWSKNGVKLVVICLLGWVFLDEGKELANKFASAPSLGIGKSTGAMFAQAGKRAAVGKKVKDPKTGKMVRKGGALGLVKGGAELGGLAANRFIGTPLRKKVGQMRNDWIKNNKNTKEIKDDKGNVIGYELNKSFLNVFKGRNILGQKVTHRVMLGENGKMTYSKDKEKLRTQIGNWARGELNDKRIGLIQRADEKLMDKFNGKNLKDGEFLITSPDGTKTIKNKKGQVVASMRKGADGSLTLENRYGKTVYDAQGNLISANKSYRNPFLLGEKQHLSINTKGQDVLGGVKQYFVDKNGKKLKGGDLRVNDQNQLVNQHGQVFGVVNNGKIFDKSGQKIIGYVKQGVFDQEGHQIAKINQAGEIVSMGKDGSVLSGVTIQNGRAVRPQASAGKYDVTRSTSSLRMEALRHAAKGFTNLNSSIENFAKSHDMQAMGAVAGFFANQGESVQNFAQNYAVKRERDLSSTIGKTSSVTKDHLISIRDIKNAQGEVIRQDIAFNTKVVKYLVDNHGELDMNMVRTIRENSQLSDEQINLAIASVVLKDRNIQLSNKFFERQATFENGQLVVKQHNLDGSETVLTTQIVNSQMIVNSETHYRNGDITIVTDNGVMSRVISQQKGKKAVASYKFSNYIENTSSVSHLINYGDSARSLEPSGTFAPGIDEKRAMVGFTNYDRQLFAQQEKYNENQVFDLNKLQPQKGTPDPISRGSETTPETNGEGNSTSQNTSPEQTDDVRERREREERARKDQERQEREERERKRQEQERRDKEDRERREQEREERERLERESKERERREQEERERQKQEREEQEKAERKRKEDQHNNAVEGNQKGDELRAQITALEARINEHNAELEKAKTELERTDIAPERREELRKRIEDLNKEAESQNALKNQLETEWNDWKKSADEHNSHVAHNEDVK